MLYLFSLSLSLSLSLCLSLSLSLFFVCAGSSLITQFSLPRHFSYSFVLLALVLLAFLTWYCVSYIELVKCVCVCVFVVLYVCLAIWFQIIVSVSDKYTLFSGGCFYLCVVVLMSICVCVFVCVFLYDDLDRPDIHTMCEGMDDCIVHTIYFYCCNIMYSVC
jgi:hypothetical protein